MSQMDRVPFEQSEQFYRYLFDAAPDVMMVIDRKGTIQVVNSRFQDLLGYVPSEAEGKPFQTLLSEANRMGLEVMLMGVADGTHLPEGEVNVLSQAGRPIPMMLDIRQIEEGEGTDHLLLRLRDLREIKVLEQEYRNLFESISDAVFIGDPETGQVYQVNRQVRELTGFGHGELVGGDYDKVHSDSWEAVREAIDDAGGEELSGRETVLKTRAGEAVPVEVYLRIVPRGEDQIYIESAIDISKRKALETRMQNLRSEWESFIRHELRSPLTPILAFSQILLEDYPDVQKIPKMVQYLDAIWQGGKRLERLLDLTREVSQYEQGEIPLQLEQGNLYETLQDAIEDAVLGVEAEDEVAQKRVELIPHAGAGDGPSIVFPHDHQKMQRALANMVKNALEHDPGRVTVRVANLGAEVGVSVHNWGKPIPEELLSTIFEKFNTTKRGRKGTGLGTTIAKLFVEAHGGGISADSSEAEGTTFAITMPKQPERDRS